MQISFQAAMASLASALAATHDRLDLNEVDGKILMTEFESNLLDWIEQRENDNLVYRQKTRRDNLRRKSEPVPIESLNLDPNATARRYTGPAMDELREAIKNDHITEEMVMRGPKELGEMSPEEAASHFKVDEDRFLSVLEYGTSTPIADREVVRAIDAWKRAKRS
jgi:hypothetical protein